MTFLNEGFRAPQGRLSSVGQFLFDLIEKRTYEDNLGAMVCLDEQGNG